MKSKKSSWESVKFETKKLLKKDHHDFKEENLRKIFKSRLRSTPTHSLLKEKHLIHRENSY